MQPSDERLFKLIQAHDTTAFDAIYARHASGLRRHLARILRDDDAVEDVLQETLLRLWTRAEHWDGRGAPRAWLYRVATNQALNQLRSIRRQRQEPLEQPRDPLDADDDPGLPAWMADNAMVGPEQAVEQAERIGQLRRLVEQLPDDKRAVVRMVHQLDMDIADVARTLGIPRGTVKSRLHYATRRLADTWREAESEGIDD